MALSIAIAGGSALGEAKSSDGSEAGRVASYLAPQSTTPSFERLDADVWQKPLDEIGLDTQPPAGKMPVDRSLQWFPPADDATPTLPATRGWGYTAFHWKPDEFFHQPLYFDEQPLERYGQTVCPVAQPVLSGMHFFGVLPIMPYKIGVDRTHDCISTYGYYPVGRCVPPTRQKLPWERDAALFEAGTWVALVFLLP